MSLGGWPILLVGTFPYLFSFYSNLSSEWPRFAAGYGNTIHLANIYISTWDTPFLCGIIAAVVQCFFAYRIWMLQKNYLWLCILIVLVSALGKSWFVSIASPSHACLNCVDGHVSDGRCIRDCFSSEWTTSAVLLSAQFPPGSSTTWFQPTTR